MGATVFYEGAAELATLTNTFRVAGVATDPTTITLVVTDPLGAATTYTYAGATITRTSAGLYTKDIPCTDVGTWSYEWTGTGAASDVDGGTWLVRQAPSSDLYCTPEELKSRTGITDNLDDAEIAGVVRSTSRWIDEHCDRVFARRTVTLELEASGPYCLSVPDLVSVTTLKTDVDGDGAFETTWTAGDYRLLPRNAAVELEPKPYTEIEAVGDYLFPTACRRVRERVQIVGVWGWPRLPEAVAEAARIISADYLALTGMKFGTMGYGDYGIVRARENSPALAKLKPYRRYPILMG
jgi:hypothetical protein